MLVQLRSRATLGWHWLAAVSGFEISSFGDSQKTENFTTNLQPNRSCSFSIKKSDHSDSTAVKFTRTATPPKRLDWRSSTWE
jgi:hypothetical protein